MKKNLSLLLLICIATGCASVHRWDRNSMTKFEMTSSETWRMTVTTAANYPPQSEKAEAIRQNWILDHARANGCREVVVKDRVWTKQPTDTFSRTGFSDSVGTLSYTGTCLRSQP